MCSFIDELNKAWKGFFSSDGDNKVVVFINGLGYLCGFQIRR